MMPVQSGTQVQSVASERMRRYNRDNRQTLPNNGHCFMRTRRRNKTKERYNKWQWLTVHWSNQYFVFCFSFCSTTQLLVAIINVKQYIKKSTKSSNLAITSDRIIIITAFTHMSLNIHWQFTSTSDALPDALVSLIKWLTKAVRTSIIIKGCFIPYLRYSVSISHFMKTLSIIFIHQMSHIYRENHNNSFV